jgi:hypothetical protein
MAGNNEEKEIMTVGVRISKNVYDMVSSLARSFSDKPDELITMMLLDMARELERRLPPSLPAPIKTEGTIKLEEEPEQKMAIVSVKFPGTLYAWMQQACKEFGITQSMLIRQAVIRYLLDIYAPKE